MKNFIFAFLAVFLFFSCKKNGVQDDEAALADASVYPLYSEDNRSFDFFGKSLSYSDDGLVLVIGAEGNDLFGASSGSAYLYSRSSADEEFVQVTLSATDIGYGDLFGGSTAVSGDGTVLAVSAVEDDEHDEGSGAVYLYNFTDTLSAEKKVTAYDGEEMDHFGDSLFINNDGSIFAVGTPLDDDYGRSRGAVYIYSKNGETWKAAKIISGDGSAGDYFGSAVALSSNGLSMAVGSPFADTDEFGTDSGTAYAYHYDPTAEEDWTGEELIPTEMGNESGFGTSVAISADGETVAVGAPYEGESGAVYLFRNKGRRWKDLKIVPSDTNETVNFGMSIDISSDGQYLLIGAPGDDSNPAYSGRVSLIRLTGLEWQEFPLMIPKNLEGSGFGSSVGLSLESKSAVVGAPFADFNDEKDSGLVYYFNLDEYFTE